MSVNSQEYIHSYATAMAPLSERQMPVFSQMGKGLRGDNAMIAFNDNGENSSLQGEYFNQMTGETSQLWDLPLMDLVPRLHYQVWKGVRTLDGETMWGYYIRFSCDITMQGDTVTFWTFDTPFTVTNPFYGTTIPEDTVIDSDQE